MCNFTIPLSTMYPPNCLTLFINKFLASSRIITAASSIDTFNNKI